MSITNNVSITTATIVRLPAQLSAARSVARTADPYGPYSGAGDQLMHVGYFRWAGVSRWGAKNSQGSLTHGHPRHI